MSQLDNIEKKVDRCLHAICGSDDDPSTGFIVRVDRLEQRWKIVLAVLTAMLTCVVGLVCKAIASVF
jgi:hypothetical protein